MLRFLLALLASVLLYLVLAADVLTGSWRSLLLIHSVNDLIPYFTQAKEVYRQTGLGVHISFFMSVIAIFRFAAVSRA